MAGADSRRRAASLSLLDGFELRLNGRFVSVPAHVQRLLAFLAIRRRPQHRVTLAGALWLDIAEDQASRNLRTALWRTRKLSAALVATDGPYVSMDASVRIDLADAIDQAEGLLNGSVAGTDVVNEVASLSGDLLPDWSDDWVLIERERVRQLRMHALEAMCVHLREAGQYAHAVDAGLAAVAAEPLRESAHRVLIEVYLAEGNLSEAMRHLDGFRLLLRSSLGVTPSPSLESLVAGARTAVVTARQDAHSL